MTDNNQMTNKYRELADYRIEHSKSMREGRKKLEETKDRLAAQLEATEKLKGEMAIQARARAAVNAQREKVRQQNREFADAVREIDAARGVDPALTEYSLREVID